MSAIGSDGFDLLDAGQYDGGLPFAHYDKLRAQGPAVWVAEPATERFAGGPGYWAIMGHAEVAEISRNPHDFSSWLGTVFVREQRPTDIKALRRMMLNMDPPEHSKVRKIVNKAFAPPVIRAQLGAAIERHSADVVDRAVRSGRVDFVGDVAAELPLLVLADVLGIPVEDRAQLYSWTNRLVGVDDPEYGADPTQFYSAFVEMFTYAREKTAQKRANPGDDLWSVIVNAEVDGERLDEDDLDRFFQLLVIAGNDTTRNLISNMLVTLHEHRDVFAQLRAQPDLLPGTIEEVLRYAPSVVQFRRTVTRDLDFHGVRMREGDRVIINYAAANRDERVFERPDDFDITRHPNRHVSFGDGNHFCLGANLARLEARSLWSELMRRTSDIRIVGTPERMRSNFMNGPRHMAVDITAAPTA